MPQQPQSAPVPRPVGTHMANQHPTDVTALSSQAPSQQQQQRYGAQLPGQHPPLGHPQQQILLHQQNLQTQQQQYPANSYGKEHISSQLKWWCSMKTWN